MPSRFTKDALSQQLTWERIDLKYIRSIISQAKAEDMSGLGLKNALSHPLMSLQKLFQIQNKESDSCGSYPDHTLWAASCSINFGPLRSSLTFQTDHQDGDNIPKGHSFGILEALQKAYFKQSVSY